MPPLIRYYVVPYSHNQISTLLRLRNSPILSDGVHCSMYKFRLRPSAYYRSLHKMQGVKADTTDELAYDFSNNTGDGSLHSHLSLFIDIKYILTVYLTMMQTLNFYRFLRILQLLRKYPDFRKYPNLYYHFSKEVNTRGISYNMPRQIRYEEIPDIHE